MTNERLNGPTFLRDYNGTAHTYTNNSRIKERIFEKWWIMESALLLSFIIFVVVINERVVQVVNLMAAHMRLSYQLVHTIHTLVQLIINYISLFLLHNTR